MHHKRRRPKNRRAGCLLCKPHKSNGAKGRAASLRLGDRRALLSAREQRDEQRDGVHEFTKRLVGATAGSATCESCISTVPGRGP